HPRMRYYGCVIRLTENKNKFLFIETIVSGLIQIL
ncbi:hypothetical protein EVA_21093, partial [gut metagenome]